MRVVVTGSTGYVVAFSVKALVDAGHRVRLLVRNPAKAATVLRALGVVQSCAAPAAGLLTDRQLGKLAHRGAARGAN